MLDIETFDNARGGNVVYKALAHPLAAARLAALAVAAGPVAVIDLDGIFPALIALCPALEVAGVFVQDSAAVGTVRGGQRMQPLTALVAIQVQSVLIAAFDAARAAARLSAFLPPAAVVLTLDEVRLPETMITDRARYLSAVNFATNFVFFRDDDHFATRLTTANYWAGYGAETVTFFHSLYDAEGVVLAAWQTQAPGGPGGYVIDSREIRERFSLPPFTGQMFIHAVGVAGHDVIKYALDTYATDNGGSLSCTHDANAWPSDRFAGLPAPRADEQVILWVQNSHAVPIEPGALSLDRMGDDAPRAWAEPVPAFATRVLDVADLFPDVTWPAQFELRAGRHLVRPRYEVVRAQRRRIAHINVERGDLADDPGIKTLHAAMGRGFLLPFPILPRARFRTIVQPTPMAVAETDMPVRLDIFAADGTKQAAHYLGVLPRRHDTAIDLDELLPAGALMEGGHADLTYDFREGGHANGWLHALFRYEDRLSGHVAESSFGAHIFNTIMTYKNEPQSYSGKPPGLSTRLFLKLGFGARQSFCALIYPASSAWATRSCTMLELYNADGALLAQSPLAIACSGSVLVYPARHFAASALREAGASGYILIRDTTCRLFGFHGVDDGAGGFSFDHMFGF